MLKHAPHTAEAVSSDSLDASVLARGGGLPAAVRARAASSGPASGRVDNPYGDRNLFCSCPPDRRAVQPDDMRILDAAQMREADRQTIDDVGMPSIVLMENAGRQVVAAIEADYEDLLDRPRRRAVRPRQQRRRRLRGGAHAGPARRGRVGVRARLGGQRHAATRALNLDILGRLGVDVVEVDDEQAGSCTPRKCSAAALIVDAIVGTGLDAAARRPARDGGRRPQHAAACRSCRSTCRAACRPTRRTSSAMRSQAAMTVTLAAPKLPLVLPPAEDHAGDVVIADIGIPPTSSTALRRAAHRAADAGAGAPHRPAAPGGLAQGRLRPRDDRGRLARQDRRGAPGGAWARCARARAWSRSRRPASCLPIVAALAPEYMTEALAETGGRAVGGAPWTTCSGCSRTSSPAAPGSAARRRRAAFVRALVERVGGAAGARRRRADGVRRRPRTRWRAATSGRSSSRRIPGEMARLLGVSIEEVQANRLDVAREFAADARRATSC